MEKHISKGTGYSAEETPGNSTNLSWLLKKKSWTVHMKPKLIQKYLQEKQVRLLWECCSSCGVTSSPVPPHCEQSSDILLLFLLVPTAAIMALTEAVVHPEHLFTLIVSATTASFQRCPQKWLRL